MADALGIDLGTTYTAAAVVRDGRAEMVTLGNRAAAVPSLLFLREDESILVAEAAERRGVAEPQRLAREFKRRVGDTTPIVLGPSPYSAERLSAQLLRWVVDEVARVEGGVPSAIAVGHPANWGAYKVDLMRQALSLAGIGDAYLIAEPVAAAVQYASMERMETGELIAVYDLGGGTFDAAVLRRTDDGFEVLGQPQGIERLGGIDFDDAIVAHVRRSLGARADELDADDTAGLSLRAQLRAECMAAKEALSSDADTTIRVALPSGAADVRITRAEFEAMVRPPLRETINALSRAIENAGVQPSDLRAVLLVGGSSRIPLVAEMVAAELGRPVAVDAHPKHAVALGAALYAYDRAHETTAGEPPGAPPPPPVPPETPGEPARGASRSRRGLVIVGAALLVLLLAAGGVWALSRDDGEGGASSSETTAPGSTTGDTSTPTSAEHTCTTESGRCAFIDGISVDGDHYVVDYSTIGYEPLMAENGGSEHDHHVHFFFDTFAIDQAGTNAPEGRVGVWTVWDLPSADGEYRFDQAKLSDRGEANKLCIGVADSAHGIDPSFGDCVDLPA
jgi:actin-like ATPase involved in cell morphogenesis